MTKKEALTFAQGLGWTKADAERAYQALNVNFSDLQSTLDYYKHEYGIEDVTDRDIAVLSLVLADFAGEVLLDRQRKQAAQQGEVTKKKNKIKEIEQSHAQEIADFKKSFHEQHSALMELLIKVYSTAKRFGLKPEPWIEAMIDAYEEAKIGTDNSQTVA
ncbi:slr0294 [Synechocystis sp. PCC 6803]|uniref:Slr0294 protein n=1 Tax=Synechocystis sp. (strain ATCC 27184 / PCC 6803 / Kazusa) TaxID=1111708 RepID=P74417_SYNY3|nr:MULTISPECIES: hypothetical protein [unclassified Synechocystis]BAM54757.1 hypothetical protein BEST7613_5826 [Synechocystis sp. PCC 6803] [Bacillus subtilis BEST7613]AGF52206.1 hypothetical protein MYO_119640 [Synechocystis sp. PCC 6803]ALJ68151.1 hypothetical protein AOY38_10105 [Synechocystis sp. PCC 6803]AVP89995.1 hypothetical protein C7I86_10145 [Synechocystis sp. IPPAS B-1465]MBD2617750.1 hypothetical protein [Synechocystis sp. FACHB-898]